MLSRNHPDRIRIAFDDTRWKQPSVYSSLKGHPPPYVVDNGRSLHEDVKALTNHSGSRNYMDIPVI